MDEIRRKYIAAFQRGLADLKAEGRDCTPEVRVELNTQYSHDLYRLYVIDALEKKPDGSIGAIEFNIDPTEESFPGQAGMRPLVWNSITFSCVHEGFAESELLAWGERWIHDESPPMGQQDGLTGIIHSVTQPKFDGNLVTLSIDFGSSPIEAFSELLKILAPSLQSAVSMFERAKA
jgi:hypothetical protein